ncbi:MAG: energy transducer TonB [Phaeospirillum sp.]|nr:energy transducer TonB [Phaeospirillum sp.]
MGETYPRQATWSPGRFGGLAAVVALHAGIIYALANGLGQHVIDIVRHPLEARVIVEVKPLPLPPPVEPAKPLPKKAPPPKPYVPPPVIRSAAPPPAAITAVTATPPPEPATATGTAEPRPGPVAEAVRVSAALDAKGSCKPPPYPPSSRRNGEAGAVVLRFLIDADGAVLESRVDTSSGFERLDEAALKGLALCHFKPGTVDGRPERSWARMRYVWKLN